ncbi:MAG: LPS biosynthesis protein [Phycisphaerae bacterium]|nr:LPS biosynthesis protein [Phycisphaerae bacterium]
MKLNHLFKKDLVICKKCIFDETVNSITFDKNGVCNYCMQTKILKKQYSTGNKIGKENLNKIISNIKKSGKNNKYDCIVGVSGGTDSSYLLYLTKKWGLRPLAVHYDNTWNTATSTQNIGKIVNKLDIDLYTHVVNNEEADDLFLSYFKAGLLEIDSSTDLALAEVTYRAAWKYGVKYVLEGHSFVTEGISPINLNYFDGKIINAVHKNFGTKKLKTYPLMTFNRFIFWTLFARIKKIRPFWYLDYNKETAQEFLRQKFDWAYYGGHHLENRMSNFAHTIYLPYKFNVDMRNYTLAARVRNGTLDRLEAWEEYKSGPVQNNNLVNYFKKRLKITSEYYDEIMNKNPSHWTDFPTYKKYFEVLRPIFYILSKKNLVPLSFYKKYCLK